MKFRTTAILAAVCLALGAGYWLVERRDAASPPSDMRGRRVFWEPELSQSGPAGRLGLSDLASSVEVRNEHGEYALERVAEDGPSAWRFAVPAERLAEGHEVDRLLSTLEFLSPSHVIADEPDAPLDLEEYGLGTSARRIRFSVGERNWTLLVGRKTLSEDEAYAMRADSGEVLIVSADIVDIAEQPLDAFRDRRALPAHKAGADRVEIRSEDAVCVLVRTEDGWRMTEPVEDTADAAEVEAFLEALAGDPVAGKPGLTVAEDGFVSDDPEDLAPYGLERPRRSVVVEFAGARRFLQMGAEEDGALYAMRSGEPSVFRLDAEKVEALLPSAERLRSRVLLHFDPADIERASIETETGPVVAVRADDGWRLDRPEPSPAESKEVEAFLDALASARVDDWIDDPGADLSPYGLDAPAAKVLLEGRRGETLELHLGAEAPDGAVHARRGEKGPVVIVPRLVRELADESHLDFLSRQALTFSADKVRALAVVRNGRSVRLERRDGRWFLAEPVQAPADRVAVQEALWELSDLQARQMVARRPDDMGRFGLDDPWVVARVEVEEEEGEPAAAHELLLGNAAGDAWYAALADGELVFLAEPSVVHRLTQEFARRRILDLAPEAVGALSLDYAVDDRSVRLERKGEVWVLSGQEERPVQPRDANALLSALTGLTARRIVEYQPEDLGPYGLDRPLFVARIERLDGSRLWLRVGVGPDDAYFAQGSETGFVCEVRESDVERLHFEP